MLIFMMMMVRDPSLLTYHYYLPIVSRPQGFWATQPVSRQLEVLVKKKAFLFYGNAQIMRDFVKVSMKK